MRKKRILLMVPMLHQGGFEKVCVRTARLLQEHCAVTILIFCDEDIAYDVTGLSIRNIEVKTREGRVSKLFNVIKRIQRVRKVKKELGTDITYSFGLTANLINIFTRMGDSIWIGIRGFTDLSSRLHPLLCRRADRVVCCSKTIEGFVREKFPGISTVSIYNPYDIEEMIKCSGEDIPEGDIRLLEENKVIVSMAREDEVKGFWHLIRAFAMVQRELPDTRLMIIGEGEYEENKRFAEELGIGDKVLFTGVKRNPFPYLARAVVYALTSLNEGFPNALVEAMALGIPAAATNCQSGPAEIFCEDYTLVTDTARVYWAEYGILLPRLNPVKNLEGSVTEPEEIALAEVLLQLCQNEELRLDYGQKGRKRAKEFSDASYVKAILSQL